MAAAALPMLIAATAVSAVGSIAQGAAAESAAKANAQAMDYNAASDRARAAQVSAVSGMKEDALRRTARARIGEQIAGSASAGAGLNADLLRQSIYNAESDASMIRYEGDLQRAGLLDQATMGNYNAGNERARGSQAMTAGYLNAAGTLLNAGNTYYAGKKQGIY